MAGEQQQQPGAPTPSAGALKTGGRADTAQQAKQPRQSDREDCIPCHLASGGMMTIAGLYSLVGARRGTDLLGQKGRARRVVRCVCIVRVASTGHSPRLGSDVQGLAGLRGKLLDGGRPVLCGAAMAQPLPPLVLAIRTSQEVIPLRLAPLVVLTPRMMKSWLGTGTLHHPTFLSLPESCYSGAAGQSCRTSEAGAGSSLKRPTRGLIRVFHTSSPLHKGSTDGEQFPPPWTLSSFRVGRA
jgi:hypothetical protein